MSSLRNPPLIKASTQFSACVRFLKIPNAASIFSCHDFTPSEIWALVRRLVTLNCQHIGHVTLACDFNSLGFDILFFLVGMDGSLQR